MPPCSELGCAAVATHGDRCAVHGAGYQRCPAGKGLRCRRCRRLFLDHEWVRVIAGEMCHATKACPDADAIEAAERAAKSTCKS